MILSLFVLAVIVIVLIARYNEDDRLFWQLLISLCTAFAIATIVRNIQDDKQSTNSSITQVCPMQVSDQSLSSLEPTTNDLTMIANMHVTDAVPASKDYTLDVVEGYNTLFKIRSKERDQPMRTYNEHMPRSNIINNIMFDTS